MNDDKKYPYKSHLLNLDFGRLGFDSYQTNDIRILLSLETPEQVREWGDAVGHEDRLYASSLLELLALSLIDDAVTEPSNCVQARMELQRIMRK
jgi:hypothetical protein